MQSICLAFFKLTREKNLGPMVELMVNQSFNHELLFMIISIIWTIFNAEISISIYHFIFTWVKLAHKIARDAYSIQNYPKCECCSGCVLILAIYIEKKSHIDANPAPLDTPPHISRTLCVDVFVFLITC